MEQYKAAEYENRPAVQASIMLRALDELSAEYAGRPDVQHAIGEFLSNVAPPQLAMLYRLVYHCGTREEALRALAGGTRFEDTAELPHFDPNARR